MYFETAWIDGTLHYQTGPCREWMPMTAEMLNDRLRETEQALQEARDQIERLEEARNII
jgi:hypothetical protein